MVGVLVLARLYYPFYFESLRLANVDRCAGDVAGPLVIYMNHSSWWDPLAILMVQLAVLPQRVLYAPVNSQALLRSPKGMRKAGFFPVERGTLKGTRQFLKDCEAILAQPDAVLCITPEGDYRDMRVRPVVLERGLAAVLSRAGQVMVVPLAFEYTLWLGRRPELLANWGEPIRVEDGRSMSTGAWHELLTERLTATMDELAEISQAREQWRFSPLIYGWMGRRNLIGLIQGVRAVWRRKS